MNTLTDFFNYELYPTLYERLDSVFQNMEFERYSGGWRSSHYLNGEKTTGTSYKRDKTYVGKSVPQRIQENGGENLSLVDFWLRCNGKNENLQGAELVEAIRPLCSLLGVYLPETDTAEYRAYKEKQEKRERLLADMKAALFSPEGADVLSYLKETRGYSEEDIKAMELGFCSKSIAEKLGDEAPYGAGSTWTLAIPYRSGGRILGFKIRTLADVKDKYRNTRTLPKKASLFGLTGLILTGNGEKDRDLTIVEGELDALRAKVRGVENIVASAGLEISEEALLEAKRRGVKRVTVLADTEETPEYAREKALQKGEDPEKAAKKAEERIAENRKKRKTAVRKIAEAGLLPLVAELPQGEKGAKTDVDSFLNGHSKDELQKIIDEAATGARYLFNDIYRRAVERQGGAATITDKAYNDYKEETLALINDTTVVSPVDRDIILSLFAQSTNGAGITKEALQAEADARKQKADLKRQEERTNELIKRASSLAADGRIEESLRLLADEAPKVRKISKETEFSSLLVTPTAEDLQNRLRQRPEGIRTDYIFSTGGREERLLLPAGAITLIACPPSHGKSTFLRNLAIQVSGNSEEGTVLYFTFEEDEKSTVYELVNTYVAEELTRPTRDYNNLTTIAEYYHSGSTQYMKEGVRDTFKRKEAAFRKNYIESGRLRIYDVDFKSNELIDFIRFIAKLQKIKAVFVDYVQLLYKAGNSLRRNEELKEIAKDLRQTAKELTLPIILAAQLNREAKSPTEMHSQNIADSADLEREANKVILLWNSAFLPLNGSTYDKDKDKIEKGKAIELGQAGKIYAKISKNRGGIPSIDATFNFNGNTGVIEPNAEEDFPDEPKLNF